MKKKITLTVIIILICAVFFIPLPTWYKDGGTVKYTALTYSVTKQHSISPDGYMVGTRVKILFWTVYDDVGFEPNAS